MPVKVSEEKKDYYKLISARLKKLRQESGLENKDILETAKNKNLILSGTYLSKMFSENGDSISLPDLVSVANIFEVDLNDLLSPDPSVCPTYKARKKEEYYGSKTVNPEFVTSPSAARMKAYLGTYHTYFFHTSGGNTSLINATLEIDADENKEKTVASFEFMTGKKDQNGNPFKKRYTGDVIISTDQQAVYIALRSDELCEISYIVFHYMPIMYETLVCRVALALTSSSGDNTGQRLPTAHRMILSRYDLANEAPEVLENLKGLLFMNENEILISEKDLVKFMEKAPEEFREYFKPKEETQLISGFAPMPYYLLSESSLRASKLDEQILNKSINLLRQYAATPKNNKIHSRYDGNLFVTLQSAFDKSKDSQDC